MSNYVELFEKALYRNKRVTVGHDTRRAGYRNRVRATVDSVHPTYVVLFDPTRNGLRSVRYDSIYCVTVEG